MNTQPAASGHDDAQAEVAAPQARPHSRNGPRPTVEQVRERSLHHQAVLRAAVGDSMMAKMGNDGWR